MYKIEAIVRPDRLIAVREALVEQGFEEFVVTEVHGHGSQPGGKGCYRGVTFEIPLSNQARVELSVPDASLDTAIDSILEAAHTGQPGDGKIFVTLLAEVIEIRHGRPSVPQDRTRARSRLTATIDADWPRG